MDQHLNIKVTGKVQGVFFRKNTRQKAEELGVKGLVKNQPDGSVYIEAEGEDDQLNEFVQWCYEGPSRAKVENVEVKKGEMKNFQRFEVTL